MTKVRQYRKPIMVSSILPKNEKTITTILYREDAQDSDILFVFCENWRHHKSILRFTDLLRIFHLDFYTFFWPLHCVDCSEKRLKHHGLTFGLKLTRATSTTATTFSAPYFFTASRRNWPFSWKLEKVETISRVWLLCILKVGKVRAT